MFSKKKDMVDLADLPKRNANLPYGKSFVPNDGTGFVDLTQKRILPSELRKQKGLEPSSNSDNVFASSNSNSFAFFDSPKSSSASFNSTQASSDEQGEMMRKISSQISDLDTKLYKMEQRIELLEKKAGIDSSSSSSGGFGW